MEGLSLVEPTDLFNLLNQCKKYPMLSNPNYLLLLDVRITEEYMESHILTAKLVKKGEDGIFQLPYDAELETKKNIIIYDNRTSSLSMQDAPAVALGKILWQNGSKYPVKILKGGYEEFSALHPYLRTQEMLYTPQQLDKIFTYPVEIVPGFLYNGTLSQSLNHKINKDLKIKAHINATQSKHSSSQGNESDSGAKAITNLLNVSVSDNKDGDILQFFAEACRFIDLNNNGDGTSLLVFSELGISRSIAICLAYLMHHHKWTLKSAWDHVTRCKYNMCPNRYFVNQLASWEEQILGKTETDINDLIC